MKKIIFILSFTLSFSSGFTQFSSQGIEEVQQFLKSKTYVVLHDTDTSFNENFKKVVEKNWKVTPYEFIFFKDLDKYSKSNKNYFLLVTSFDVGQQNYGSHHKFYTNKDFDGGFAGLKTVQKIENGKLTTSLTSSYRPTYGTNVLNVAMGNSDQRRFNQYPYWLSYCYAGAGYVNLDSPKLNSTVLLVNNAIELMKNKGLKKLKISSGDTAKEYNTEESLKEKTIIFLDREIPYYDDDKKIEFTNNQIAENFKGKFKVIKDDEYSKNLESKDKQYLYYGLFSEGSYSVIYLHDVEGKIYFFKEAIGGTDVDSKRGFIGSLRKFDKRFEK